MQLSYSAMSNELDNIERSEQMKMVTFQKRQPRIHKKESFPEMPAVITIALVAVTLSLVLSSINDNPETAGSLTDKEAIENMFHMQLNKPEVEFFEVVYAQWQRSEAFSIRMWTVCIKNF